MIVVVDVVSWDANRFLHRLLSFYRDLHILAKDSATQYYTNATLSSEDRKLTKRKAG